MPLDDYKVLLYRNQPSGWVAEVPSIPGCYALVPTRAEALAELAKLALRAEEFRRAAVRLGFESKRQTGSDERWHHPDGRSVTM